MSSRHANMLGHGKAPTLASPAEELRRRRQIAWLHDQLLERVTAQGEYSDARVQEDLGAILGVVASELGFSRAYLHLVTDAERRPIAGAASHVDRRYCVVFSTHGYSASSARYLSFDSAVWPLEDCRGLTRSVIESGRPVQVYYAPTVIESMERRGVLTTPSKEEEAFALRDFQERLSVLERSGAITGGELAGWTPRLERWTVSAMERDGTEGWLAQRERWFRTGFSLMADPGDFEHFEDYVRCVLVPAHRGKGAGGDLMGWVTLQGSTSVPPQQPIPDDVLEYASMLLEAIRIPLMVSSYSRALAAQTHAALRERERAARAEQTEVLAGQMAHEVRGEISPLLMALDSIQGRLPFGDAFQAIEGALVGAFAPADAKQRQDLRQAAEFLKSFSPTGEVASQLKSLRGVGERIARTVEGVMDYARLGKELAEEGGSVDLSALVSDVAREFPADRVTVEPSPVVAVRGHADRLRQALRNLVRNAVEAVDEAAQHGRPPAVVVVSLGQQDGKALIRVKDQGVGMSPEQRAKLFTPMFTTKPTTGHGLGLATAQRIVQSHGGEILAESAPGVGSTFTVSLLPQHLARR